MATTSLARLAAAVWIVLLLWLASFSLCRATVVGSETERDKCLEKEEEEFNSKVRVATLQFEEVQIQFLVVVFIMIVVLARLVWHHPSMHRVASNIPESCMLIVVGAHIGGIVIGSFYLDECRRRNDVPPLLRFTPNLFFLYLLPPIVLEAGYFLNIRAFFENIPTILVYAVVGTLFNAFLIGVCLFGFFKTGMLLMDGNVNFSISSALLFGTICAAVDPVAVLAVFDEIHINKLLHILVFGESLLNDAVVIVLFQVLGAFSNRSLDPSLDSSEVAITVVDVLIGIAQFVLVVTASIIIGLLVGMLGAFITRFSGHVNLLEPIIIFAMGYLSYLLADMFAFSGIVSLIVSAIIMRHYVEHNISHNSHTTIKYSMKMLSNISEMVIFLFLGVSLYDVTVHHWNTGLVLWTLILVLVFRPIGVVILTIIMNYFRVKKISWKSVFILSYSGLRGAVAFSLALLRIHDESSLRNPSTPEHRSELQLRQSMLTAITVVVLFSVFLQGMTIKPIVKILKIRIAEEHQSTMNDSIHSTALDHITAGVEDILGHVGHNRIRERVQRLDVKYLRKIFERYPEARDQNILQTFKRLQYRDSRMAAEKNLVFKWKEDKSFSDTHMSIYAPECPEPGEATEKDVHMNPEDEIPDLNDILKTSYTPHETDTSNVHMYDERDAVKRHRSDPVSIQRTVTKSKHHHRRKRKRLPKRSQSMLTHLESFLPFREGRTPTPNATPPPPTPTPPPLAVVQEEDEEAARVTSTEGATAIPMQVVVDLEAGHHDNTSASSQLPIMLAIASNEEETDL